MKKTQSTSYYQNMDINGHRFVLICAMKPEKDTEGNILRFEPQDKYENKRGVSLNKYGSGKFCRFRIPVGINQPGVYIITVNNAYKYMGECVDLSLRFNMGYGQISPRNCFTGGQETNCRINKLILEEALTSGEIKLWFYKTRDYKRVEKKLLGNQKWPWNRSQLSWMLRRESPISYSLFSHDVS
ncbi:MAG: hypothetical protein HZA28_06295 [Candidatus Omnitrophica bacterium]|nr:hypothetical protein [Candidatus Omnitrophota bacterium]